MSMSSDHAQAIADNIAIDKYGMKFGELPVSYQKKLFNKAQKMADKEIRDLVRGK